MKRYPVVRFIIVIIFLYLLYMIAHTKDFGTHVSKLHVNLYHVEKEREIKSDKFHQN